MIVWEWFVRKLGLRDFPAARPRNPSVHSIAYNPLLQDEDICFFGKWTPEERRKFVEDGKRGGLDNFAVATTKEPPPIPNDRPGVWSLVVADMEARDNFGLQKYGVKLQPHNGRDALKDVYQELLDAAVYIRQLIYERDGK